MVVGGNFPQRDNSSRIPRDLGGAGYRTNNSI